MTAKELRTLLTSVPDDARVLVPAFDHSYRTPVVNAIGTALYDVKSRTWTEDYGEKTTPEGLYGKRVRVVIFE